MLLDSLSSVNICNDEISSIISQIPEILSGYPRQGISDKWILRERVGPMIQLRLSIISAMSSVLDQEGI